MVFSRADVRFGKHTRRTAPRHQLLLVPTAGHVAGSFSPSMRSAGMVRHHASVA
jgi:hypothetical protein